jgi:hypothetical protein
VIECICGYLAADEVALDDHIDYTVCVVGEDGREHKERR